MNKLSKLRRDLHAMADPELAVISRRFFKTGPGHYGEGDKFLGVTVPQVRSLVARTDDLTNVEVVELLHSGWHEERLLALCILVKQFVKSKHDIWKQKALVDIYLANTAWINNWDLVDTSAPQILGVWLLNRDRASSADWRNLSHPGSKGSPFWPPEPLSEPGDSRIP